jgi:putative transposase
MWRVGPICEVLTENYCVPVSASCHCAFKHRGKSARDVEDARLSARIEAVYEANYSCHGVREVWRALLREGETAARCTVERLIKRLGLRGAARGKTKRAAVADRGASFAEDPVKRRSDAPKPDNL